MSVDCERTWCKVAWAGRGEKADSGAAKGGRKGVGNIMREKTVGF
jgi:hypothetical protein